MCDLPKHGEATFLRHAARPSQKAGRSLNHLVDAPQEHPSHNQASHLGALPPPHSPVGGRVTGSLLRPRGRLDQIMPQVPIGPTTANVSVTPRLVGLVDSRSESRVRDQAVHRTKPFHGANPCHDRHRGNHVDARNGVQPLSLGTFLKHRKQLLDGGSQLLLELLQFLQFLGDDEGVLSGQLL
jgi:hypothetical protein